MTSTTRWRRKRKNEDEEDEEGGRQSVRAPCRVDGDRRSTGNSRKKESATRNVQFQTNIDSSFKNNIQKVYFFEFERKSEMAE